MREDRNSYVSDGYYRQECGFFDRRISDEELDEFYMTEFIYMNEPVAQVISDHMDKLKGLMVDGEFELAKKILLNQFKILVEYIVTSTLLIDDAISRGDAAACQFIQSNGLFSYNAFWSKHWTWASYTADNFGDSEEVASDAEEERPATPTLFVNSI
jgi:hypothetical protein